MGNVILSTAIAYFNSNDDIAPGEVFEEVGSFYNIDGLDSFESDTFDTSNLNCSYTKR